MLLKDAAAIIENCCLVFSDVGLCGTQQMTYYQIPVFTSKSCPIGLLFSCSTSWWHHIPGIARHMHSTVHLIHTRTKLIESINRHPLMQDPFAYPLNILSLNVLVNIDTLSVPWLHEPMPTIHRDILWCKAFLPPSFLIVCWEKLFSVGSDIVANIPFTSRISNYWPPNASSAL